MIDFCGDCFLGLSINNTVLRGVIVNTKEKKIHSLVEQRVKEEMLDGGTFLKPEVFKEAFKKLVANSKFIPRCVSISLPEKYALTRELSFPDNINEGEIAEAVSWQARNIFPLPFDQMYVDWKMLEVRDSRKEVFVAALPKRLVDDLVKIVTQLGFRPINIQTSAACLGRLIPSKETGFQVLINANLNDLEVTLIADNITKMTATSSFDPENPKEMVVDAISTAKRLQDFYKAKYTEDLEVKKIWITGELATESLKEGLSLSFKVPVDYLKLPISLKGNNKIAAFSETIAIALSPIEEPDSNRTINLLPPDLQDFYNSNIILEKVLKSTNAIIAILIFSLLLTLTSYAYLFYKTRNLSAYKEETLAVFEGEPSEDVEVTIERLNNQIDKIISLAKEKSTPKRLFSQIAESIPEGIAIQSWRYNKETNQVVLEGHTVTRESLLNLQAIFEKQPEFKQVILPLDNLAKKEDYNFQLFLELRR